MTSSIAALPPAYAFVDVICLPHSEAIFKMNKRVRHIHVIPRNKIGLEKFKAYFHIFKKLFSEHYDLLAQFSIDWRGAFLARALNVDLTVARISKRRGFFWHTSFDRLAPPLDKDRPMAEQDVDLLRTANLYKKSSAPAYQLKVNIASKMKVRQWLKQNEISRKNKLVVIHPFSRWKFKEISTPIWIKIINALHTKNLNVVLSGAIEDHERIKIILQSCKLKPIFTLNFSLEETTALYEIADLVITIDSMSTHLSSAVRTPVISIFGPTNKMNWGPWKVKSSIISFSVKYFEKISFRSVDLNISPSVNRVNYLIQNSSKILIRQIFNFIKQLN